MCRRYFLRSTLAAAFIPLLGRIASADTEIGHDAVTEEDSRTAWFREAKFGMFIHWGPYSLASVEASWPIMQPEHWGITEAEYRALPARFNPVHYDPDHFIDLARTAGQKYIVFTTKHHDGFCMFDSAYTDYKITNTPYGKDIVKQLADACARRAMPLGFYYSPPDMHHSGFRDTSRPASENWNGQPERPAWSSYLQYMQLQLSELLNRYGDVRDIWFDGLFHQEKYDGRRFLDLIHRLQPGTLVNDRIGVRGDYVTPEQFIPRAIPTKGVEMRGADASVQKDFHSGIPSPAEFQLWETCMTINNTWAYNAHDHHFKSGKDLIRGLVEVASRGGNFLLNVGPQPDGLIQPEFQDRLRTIGDWITANGESIYGTTYGPIQGQTSFRTTAKGSDLYVHVLDWPSNSLVLTGLPGKVLSARLLANNQPLRFQQTPDQIAITVPPQAPDPNVSVIALRML
ncbi:MAG: alpha-L-fucosidase [Candidatus Sulfotelmatobacter sp.]